MARLFGRNIEYHPFKKHSAWRKIAIGTWNFPGDPSIYGKMEIDVTHVLDAIRVAETRGLTLTPVHFVASAIAKAISHFPQANGVIRFGRVYYRKDINICIPVAADAHGEDLTGIILRHCDQLSLEQIADRLTQKTEEIRTGKDEEFESTKSTLSRIPGIFMNSLFKFLGWILFGLNFWFRPMGIPKDSFGSAQVTSLGAHGVQEGWGPLDPYSRCPIMIVAGMIRKRTIVIDDKIEIRPMMSLCYTFDHRVIDGAVCSKLGAVMKKILERPGAGYAANGGTS